MKTYSGLAGLLVALLLICGCAQVSTVATVSTVPTVATVATVAVSPSALRRLDHVGVLPKGARVGMTAFTVCGGSYLDKLNPEYHEQDATAVFYNKCSELGHPQTFSNRLRLRLEEKLGRKLVLMKADKSFKPKLVLRDAKKLGLEYVIAGDLLYLGESDNKTVVSVLLYLIRVNDGKLMVVGRVKKEGAIGKVLAVIDDIADELYAKAHYAE